MPVDPEVTALLAAMRAGDRAAVDRLFPLVYRELHAAAHRQLVRFRPGDTLDTTALVHEAYLRLAGNGAGTFEDRRHFFAVAARAMRQIIVDHARRRGAERRGGGRAALSLERVEVASPERSADLVALDEALTTLGRLNERLVRVVELRFFAGLSVDETAQALDLSPRTVKREWQKARAYLYRAVTDDGAQAAAS